MERKIIIVDDDEQTCELYALAFSINGYEVATAESAEEALEIVSENPFWINLLDLNLPGMNGIELCRQIKKQYPKAIPIAVTGYASYFELAACRDAGFEDYFTKPVQLFELIEAADHAFKKLERWRKK